MAALTASQAPQPAEGPDPDGAGRSPVVDGMGGASAERRGPERPYHTELPPLQTARPGPGEKGERNGAPEGDPIVRLGEAGIPATVLEAYRRAEAVLADTMPGCGLDWEMLAAIGKVESGHARGGAVDPDGTTVEPILGPVLDGNGFAEILDTDNGAWDADRAFDRAVGPMQFIPSTWATWSADGNGDGVSDPNNVYDAALAAGHYLCAGDRDLNRPHHLDQALLSYNSSWRYVRTVRAWLEFYYRNAHEVPDGEGPLPTTPGPGNPDDLGDGGGDEPTDGERPPAQEDPTATASPSESSEEPSESPLPTPTGGILSPSPSPSGSPQPKPSISPSDPDPTSDPSGSEDPVCPTGPSESGDPTDPDPTDSATGEATSDPTPDPGESGEECEDPEPEEEQTAGPTSDSTQPSPGLTAEPT